ncbi:MAG: ParB/RepB/Spo0J family partition protein [Treponema sp.]|nr:ParB/RepB/Spo0J family partition protein [Treponema sp.]
MALKKGLGKGLSALLPNEAPPAPKGEEKGPAAESLLGGKGPARELEVSLDILKANPAQPRKHFNEEELTELADSIRQQGIIQPIIAEEAPDGTYSIVAGERRARAARMAGLEKVPVILRSYSEEKRIEVALIENIQRSNLNPIEEAAAYKQLMERGNLSQDEAALRVGKNRATVANALRLLRLPLPMQESIQKGDMSPGHGRAILSLTGSKTQEALLREELYKEILRKGLSVREAEKRAAKLGEEGKKKEKTPPKRDSQLNEMEEKFRTRLGTKVILSGDLSKGSIHIDYYSMEDLQRLYDILGGEEP